MISELPLFQIVGAMARYAAESQKVSATNIAHADEPGYKGAKLESFEEYIKRNGGAAPASGMAASFRVLESGTPASPNGNTVDLEQEMFTSADAMGQHSLALSVYEKSLQLLRTAVSSKR